MTVMDLSTSSSRAPLAPGGQHVGTGLRAALVLDGAALARTRFMVSPMNELLAQAARHAGAAGPGPARPYRSEVPRRDARTEGTVRRLTAALRAVRWPVARLLSPTLLDRTSCPGFEEELEALRARMTEGCRPFDSTYSGRAYGPSPGRPEPLGPEPVGAAHDRTDGPPSVPVEEIGELIEALRAAFGLWLAEDWPAHRRALEDDVACRAHQLARHGAARLLDTLHDQIAYADQILYVSPPPYAAQGGGRGPAVQPPQHSVDGLLLVPSAVAAHPTVLSGGELPVLRYPCTVRATRDEARAATEPTPLAALLGRARSDALTSIGTGCSTTELACRLGVGAATASSHAAALRRAGLIVTHRRGKQVEHLLTELGSQLLTAGHG
ncbi:hypothetical protein ABZ636_06610 [Streptomyces sp. NPDC007251]|uniref:hypothetical protein n=1 Tax=unclassified Streptomyces TaxID=2593676 RepID=UPI0033DDBB2B